MAIACSCWRENRRTLDLNLIESKRIEGYKGDVILQLNLCFGAVSWHKPVAAREKAHEYYVCC